ncbi:hypothetical protein BU16DRAFT_85337 [Lophium mytilinum]|uniref:Uncharacterized protein n=1 Tax=Lophium mytilinum TaxID=390894 RepID=A0A6A6QNW5_9PEZI|nr:hypothetical protein BU16DRAFT_85337 [Lophium mytilinum]
MRGGEERNGSNFTMHIPMAITGRSHWQQQAENPSAMTEIVPSATTGETRTHTPSLSSNLLSCSAIRLASCRFLSSAMVSSPPSSPLLPSSSPPPLSPAPPSHIPPPLSPSSSPQPACEAPRARLSYHPPVSSAPRHPHEVATGVVAGPATPVPGVRSPSSWRRSRSLRSHSGSRHERALARAPPPAPPLSPHALSAPPRASPPPSRSASPSPPYPPAAAVLARLARLGLPVAAARTARQPGRLLSPTVRRQALGPADRTAPREPSPAPAWSRTAVVLPVALQRRTSLEALAARSDPMLELEIQASLKGSKTHEVFRWRRPLLPPALRLRRLWATPSRSVHNATHGALLLALLPRPMVPLPMPTP